MLRARAHRRSEPDRHGTELVEKVRQPADDQMQDLFAGFDGRRCGVSVITGIVALKIGGQAARGLR